MKHDFSMKIFNIFSTLAVSVRSVSSYRLYVLIEIKQTLQCQVERRLQFRVHLTTWNLSQRGI